MTVLMSFIGLIVFAVSCFTATFSVAFKRLLLFAGAGVFIDMLIIGVSLAVSCVIS